MKKILITILLISFISSLDLNAAEEDEGGTIIYAPSAVYIVIAPPGWTLDHISGRRHGLPAVLYPKGASWTQSPIVMYVNNAEKRTQRAQSLIAFIHDEEEAFRKRHPNIRITDGKSLSTGDGRQMIVKHFAGDRWGNYEAVAYIDEEKTYTSFTLSSKTKTGFEKAYPAFNELVASYIFITSEVRAK